MFPIARLYARFAFGFGQFVNRPFLHTVTVYFREPQWTPLTVDFNKRKFVRLRDAREVVPYE